MRHDLEDGWFILKPDPIPMPPSTWRHRLSNWVYDLSDRVGEALRELARRIDP